MADQNYLVTEELSELRFLIYHLNTSLTQLDVVVTVTDVNGDELGTIEKRVVADKYEYVFVPKQPADA